MIGVGETGSDPAADRQDPVHQPDAVLEVPALDRGHRRDQQVAERVAGEAVRLARGLREAVLEDLAHQRLRVGQRHDAVADVADRRDPELLAQDPGRATIVGDRHDRGQVAGVFLEAAQERGQPGAATDRDDPRAASEEPLLVDQLDQWLVRIRSTERIGQDVDRPPRTEQDEDDADRSSHETAQGERQELERQQVDQPTGHPGRLVVARDLAQEVGERDRQQQEADEDDEQPALDPDPRGQPAPQVHVRSSSRWKTATGP